jgi:hypothetical protein
LDAFSPTLSERGAPIKPEVQQWASLLGKFDEQEHTILLAGLTLATATGADIDSVMQGVSKQIEEYRASKLA